MSDDPCSGAEAQPAAVSAVVDRIVDGVTAVLLVEDADQELHLPVERLPDGATDGTWVLLEAHADPPVVIGIDHDRTRARRREIDERMERLRRERRGGRFDRTT